MGDSERRIPLRAVALRFGVLLAGGWLLLTLVLVVLERSYEHQRLKQIEARAEAVLDQANRDLRSLFFEISGDLGVFSRLPPVRRAVMEPSPAHWQEASALFRSFMVEYRRYPAMEVLNLRGQPVVSTYWRPEDQQRLQMAERHPPQELLGQPQLSTFLLGRDGSRPLLFVARPLHDEGGQVRDLLWVDLDLTSAFERLVDALALPDRQTQAWVGDRAGSVYATSPAAADATGNLLRQFPVLQQALQSGARGMLQGPDGLLAYRLIAPLQPAAGNAQILLLLRLSPTELQRGSLWTLPQAWAVCVGLFGTVALACGLLAYNQVLAAHQRDLNAAHAARLHHLSITDPLTGLANRRHFEQAAMLELSRCQRYGSPLALLLLDLDHFKQINDRYGHATGDSLLKAFADRLREQLRDVDLAARWGGEEFVVLMPATSPDQALLVAERLRQQIQTITLAARPLLGGAHEQLLCTVSIGVALGEMEETLLELLLHKADEGLYAAKAAGRNCLAVVKVDDPEVPINVMSSQTGRA